MLVFTAFRAGAEPVTALAFSPDGGLVSNGPRAILLRSEASGQVRESLPCDIAKITSLTFALRRHWLVVAGGRAGVEGRLQVFDWRTRRVTEGWSHPTDLVTRVAVSAREAFLGAASADHTARIWRLMVNETGLGEAVTLVGHSGPVLNIAFSPDEKMVVTASADRSVKVWSTEDGRLLRSFNQHTEAVHALVFRPVSDAAAGVVPACATGGDDRTVRVWQPEIGRMVRIVRRHAGAVFALAYAIDGASLFSAGAEGVIRRIDADSDEILNEWPAHTDWIYSLAISPDGLSLASGDWTGAVKVWDLSAQPPSLRQTGGVE